MLRIICILVILLACSPVFAANQTMEISIPKASGTGTPAISSNHRIFYAYPGIEYNIRAAVIGGDYPYTYELTTYPTGMEINSRTGEITWANPTATGSPHSCAIRVTDTSSTQVTASWSVSVTSSTSRFVFVDSSAGSGGDGSISSPYDAIADLSGLGANIIAYFRAGTYSVGNGGWYNESSYPTSWLAYPDETPLIDMNDRELAYGPTVYFDGLEFYNMDYSGVDYSGVDVCNENGYTVVRRCTFRDFSNTTSTNNNYGMLKAMCVESQYYYMVFQDNIFYNFQGGNAIGSIYHQSKFLIENNHIYNALGQGSGPSHNGISPKTGVNTVTVRGNKIIMGNGWLWGYNNSDMGDDVEFCFNLFVKSGDRSGGMMNYNTIQETTWFYRNTLIGDLVLRACTSAWDCTISQNIISNPNTAFDEWSISNFIAYNDSTDCFTNSNNLTNTTASTLVDSAAEYKLVESQSAYVGLRGWQLSDGLTPMELVDEDPTPSTHRSGGAPSSFSGTMR